MAVLNSQRIALVTGARRGIGLACASALAASAYHVVMSAASQEADAAEAVRAVRESGGSCDYISCDISDADARENLFSEINSRYGRLDVLVNNAGVAPEVRADVLETTAASFDRVMDINLKGTFFMSQAAALIMLAAKSEGIIPDYSPRIINISSISADTSSTTRGEYCISKAGISMVTKLFADRLTSAGIHVFEVRPGIILTDMTEAVKEKYSNLIEQGLLPSGRIGVPEDVANCVLAACSGFLDYSAGQVLLADGGFSLSRL